VKVSFLGAKSRSYWQFVASPNNYPSVKIVTIENNIAKVWDRIRLAEKKYARSPKSVQLIAVSKTKPAADIRQAAATGQRDFGENYLQEALEKIQQLGDLELCWHFIGPLQSNKTRAIAEHFNWVHSVDRLKIAQRLSDQRPAALEPINICLQVNISGETSKTGVTVAALPELAQQIAPLANIRLRGLMAIPEASNDFDQQRANFDVLQQTFTNLQASLPELDTLSMGMSGDLEAAIASGATFVRIGTDIFGARL
jgi:pyridoxal phosphate enzyme (YggS family)